MNESGAVETASSLVEAVAFCQKYAARIEFAPSSAGLPACASITIHTIDHFGPFVRQAFGRTLVQAYRNFQKRFALPFVYPDRRDESGVETLTDLGKAS